MEVNLSLKTRVHQDLAASSFWKWMRPSFRNRLTAPCGQAFNRETNQTGAMVDRGGADR